MKSDGTEEQVVSQIGNPFFAEWSWSGTKLAYEFTNAPEQESQGGAFVYDVQTKKTVAVSAPYRLRAFDADDGPRWSPDERYVTYRVEPGLGEVDEQWVAEADTGKSWRLLPGRGETKNGRWRYQMPLRLSLRLDASGDESDLATINLDSTDLIMLTDIGAQEVRNRYARWSPDGEWICYASDIEMTQTEREESIEDCWLVRPDGSDARNLTKASTPSTERQLGLHDLFWSWDSRWILSDGTRFDKLAREIPTLYLIDPVNGGYRPALTSYPQETGVFNFPWSWQWSYDGTKLAVVIERSVVKNWGPDAQFEQPRWVLSLYDVGQDTWEDLLVFDEQLDRKMLIAVGDRDESPLNIWWSPDNRSILLTIALVVSKAEEIFQPDVYRLDLPERLISPLASQHIGPPVGRDAAAPVVAQVESQPEDKVVPVTAAPEPVLVQTGEVTETIVPLYMTVDEALGSLPGSYGQYVTTNVARNLILFKGPAEVLAAFLQDLKKVDTPPPHVLVDLLAVELSDEANRSLGLDWTYAEGRFAFFQPGGGELFMPPVLPGLRTFPGTGQAFYQGVGQLPREFFVRLNTLVRDGEGTILANPRTVSMSGRESLIQIRKTVNFFFNEGFDVSGRPIVKKSDISADTVGRITPTLLPDGEIHVLVDVSVGTFTFTQAEKLPEQTTRQSTTEVTVHEKETIVIGGLRQQEVVNSTTKVPILGSIPYIKPFFTKYKKDVRHSVLTIFITPQVLDPDDPTPEWPQLNGEDHEIVPIIDESKFDWKELVF
jgi:hypothetical protein